MDSISLAPTLPFSDMKLWALEAELRGVQTSHRREAFPLSEFPDHHLIKIRAEVEATCKPPYWLDFGLAQIPSRSWWEWHWQRGIDPDGRRSAVPTRVRNLVMARDGFVCQICLLDVEPSDVHLDHIKPWSRGGQHTVANLRVTHSVCNMRKAARY